MPSFIIKMRKQLLMILGIALISLTTALYAGECMEIDLSKLDHSEDIFYIVTGNSSNLDGMNITLDSNTKNASVCFAINYKPDTFTLTFFNKDKEIIVEHHYFSSGRSSKTIYVQNKTIEYMDKIIYKDNETIKEETFKDPEVNILKDTSWEYWYLYLFTFGVISGLVYLWVKYIYGKEESEILDELEKEDVSPLE